MSSPGKGEVRPDLPWLTIARFPAALWVLVHHTWGSLAPLFPEGIVRDAGERVVSRGGLAVAFFFILSGFILAWVHPEIEPADRKRFYLARFARIWPVYMLSLLVALPIFVDQIHEMLVLHPGAPGWARAAVRGAASLLFLQAWQPNLTLFWNVAAWSLSCEAFFYLLFPFLLPRLRALGGGGLWIAIALCLLPMAGRFALYRAWPTLHLNFNPLVRLPEFVAGICLALLFRRGFRIDPRLAVLSALGVVVPAIVADQTFPWLVVMHAAFLGTLAALASSRTVSSGPFLGSLVVLGQASFALYLLHAPLALYLLPRLPEGPVGWFAYLAVVLVVSWMAYRWLEMPARKWILSVASRGGRPTKPA